MSHDVFRVGIDPNMASNTMGFGYSRLWVMGYRRIMGYGVKIPAHQVGGPAGLWIIGGYGLSQAWVKTGSTVPQFHTVINVAVEICSAWLSFRFAFA